MGWSGRRNSELIRLVVAQGFGAFLTVDQNLPFQQNLRAAGVAVIVLVARTNRLKELQPLVPDLLGKLGGVEPDAVVQIGA